MAQGERMLATIGRILLSLIFIGAGLSKIAASSVQLAGPVLAAAGGVVFLGEQLTLRLLLASMLVLGGLGLVLIARPDGLTAPAVASSRR